MAKWGKIEIFETEKQNLQAKFNFSYDAPNGAEQEVYRLIDRLALTYKELINLKSYRFYRKD